MVKRYFGIGLLICILGTQSFCMEVESPKGIKEEEPLIKKKPKKSLGKKLVLDVQREKTLIPQGKATNRNAFINLNETDLLTRETFKELIEKKKQQGLPFILAVVKTRSNDIRTYRFYSALELNAYLKDRSTILPKDFVDPMTHEIIIGEVYYFTIDNLDDEFKYLGSDYDILMGSENKGLFMEEFFDANEGKPEDQQRLGTAYIKGIGIEQNFKEALKYFKLAADQGNVVALNNLGYLYQNGLGVQKDYKEAARLYKLAADQGYVLAQVSLGIFYSKGLGVQKDYKEAARLFKLAADQGDVLAQKYLERVQKLLIEKD